MLPADRGMNGVDDGDTLKQILQIFVAPPQKKMYEEITFIFRFLK